MGLQEIKDLVDRRLYKELSNANQRDEACRKTEALWHNCKLDGIIDFEMRKTDRVIMSAKAEIERTILDLIIQRDENK